MLPFNTFQSKGLFWSFMSFFTSLINVFIWLSKGWGKKNIYNSTLGMEVKVRQQPVLKWSLKNLMTYAAALQCGKCRSSVSCCFVAISGFNSFLMGCYAQMLFQIPALSRKSSPLPHKSSLLLKTVFALPDFLNVLCSRVTSSSHTRNVSVRSWNLGSRRGLK